MLVWNWMYWLDYFKPVCWKLLHAHRLLMGLSTSGYLGCVCITTKVKPMSRAENRKITMSQTQSHAPDKQVHAAIDIDRYPWKCVLSWSFVCGRKFCPAVFVYQLQLQHTHQSKYIPYLLLLEPRLLQSSVNTHSCSFLFYVGVVYLRERCPFGSC